MSTPPEFGHYLPKPPPRETKIQSVLRWFTEPPDSLAEPQHGQARLLAYLLLSLIASQMIIFPLVLPIQGFRESGQMPVYLFLVALFCLAYGLLRARHYTLAANIAVWLTAAAVWVFAIVDRGNPGSFASDLAFVVISVTLSGLLLPVRMTLLLAGLHMAGILFWAIVIPPALDFSEALTLSILVVVTSALTGVVSILRQRDQENIQRQADALREAEERFHLVSYATSDVVWDWDLSSDRIWRNQGVQRLFGYKDDEIGTDMAWWQARVHSDEREKFTGSIQQALKNGEKFWSKEYRFRRADGGYAYVFDRSYIIYDGHGTPVRMLGAIMDITSRKHTEEVLLQEAVHDRLTGLFNRRYMEEMLERELRHAEQARQPICIILFDIDHFKQVNDTLGHAAGDVLLQKLGAFLLKHVRGTDIACRYGGDEFILILPNVSLDVARQRAVALCAGAGEFLGEQEQALPQPLTFSAGVAIFPDQGQTREAIFEAADAALYRAKEAGRNQVVVGQKRPK